MSEATPPPQPAPPPAATSTKRTWRELHLWQIQPVRDVLVVLLVIFLIRLGYTLQLVTVPMLLALLLAYLFEPLVLRMTNVRWISRKVAALFIILGAAVLIVAPVLIGVGLGVVQGINYAGTVASNVDLVIQSSARPDDADLRSRLPDGFWLWLRDEVTEIREHERVRREKEEALKLELQERDALDPNAPPPEPEPELPPEEEDDVPIEASSRGSQTSIKQQAAEAGSGLYDMALRWVRDNAKAIATGAVQTGAGAVGVALRGVQSLGLLLFTGFLTAFFFYFFCTSWGNVRRFWRNLIPEKRRDRVLDLLGQMDRVVSGFIRGRLTIAAVQTVFFIIGYWFVGVPIPLILGPIVGVLSIVPYVGMLGIPITVIAMWLDPQPLFGWQEAFWWTIVGPAVIFWLGQTLDDYVLTPIIQGKSTDMETPAILFASISGGILAGVYGLLLAIPVAACLKILLREIFWPRFRAWTEGRASDPLPLGNPKDPVTRVVAPPPPTAEG